MVAETFTSSHKNASAHKSTGSQKSVSKHQSMIQASCEFARKKIESTRAETTFPDNSGNYPKFSKDEVSLGRLLGKGGFGSVYEVRGFDAGKPTRRFSISTRNLKLDDADEEVEAGEMESRAFISKHCIRHGGDARYAAKFLKKEVAEDPAMFIQGLIDMGLETLFLSAIEHPNIIKLRAVASTQSYNEDYFIVLDRLYDTLEDRLKKWDSRNRRSSGIAGKLTDRKGKKNAAVYEERIVAAFDLSDAVKYLHGRKIIYRDLKPENIGFDIRGDIKIFDFGLAKELHDKDKNADGTYNLTGLTGSLRYMAPEVANEKPYNASCDVYSFAVLLWEMMALKPPYEMYTPRSLREKVYNGAHKRPLVDEAWPVPIKLLLKKAWCAELKDRLSMTQVTAILRKECVRVRGGDESGLEHQRRRSTFVFRGRGTLSK